MSQNVPDLQPVFRFAPSPNGELHIGHALSALTNRRMAEQLGGVFLLRFDDTDRGRVRPQFESQILDDLAWLGITWSGDPLRFTDVRGEIDACLKTLRLKGLTFQARLSRKQIKDAATAHERETGTPWPKDPDGAPFYPKSSQDTASNGDAAERLRMSAAAETLGRESVSWTEFDNADTTSQQERAIADWGDVILRAKSGDDVYTFATVVHDNLIGISHIVRGMDMQENTTVQRVLQELLGLPAPIYHHHRLVLDDAGKKLSKSDRSISLRALRAEGMTREQLFEQIGWVDG
ncbi:MAG: tRNA glutamyl-Q(34) synthetase GluQRS [Alphaproteobacteria bacterium]